MFYDIFYKSSMILDDITILKLVRTDTKQNNDLHNPVSQIYAR